MSEDILKRLRRQYAMSMFASSADLHTQQVRDRNDAADEIERLRAAAVPDGITDRLRYVVDLLSEYDDEAVQGALATLAGRAIILDIVARRLAASQQAAKGEGA